MTRPTQSKQRVSPESCFWATRSIHFACVFAHPPTPIYAEGQSAKSKIGARDCFCASSHLIHVPVICNVEKNI